MKKALVFIFVCFASTVMFAAQDLHYQINSQGMGSMYTKLFGTIYIDGVEQNNPNYEIGVFDQDGICRGAKLPTKKNSTGQYYYSLQIRGLDGFTYTFKVWDHENDVELDLISEVVDENGDPITYQGNYTYQYNGVNTGVSNLYPLHFSTPSTYTLDIEGYGTSDGGYYLIASPLADDIDPVTVGMITDDLGADATPETSTYDLYWFNQSEEEEEWQNYRLESFNLTNGKGYLYASKEDNQLSFTGTPYSGDGSITLAYDTEDPAFAGWNLVGNPFPEVAGIDREDYYILNEDGSELMEGSGDIPAMAGIFVLAEQEGETMTFTPADKGKSSPNLALNLSQGRGVVDRAVVRFTEGRMLPKFQMNPSNTKVYIPQGGKDYAVVRAGEMGEMPVNFKAEKNGSYTLNFTSEEVSFGYLHLVDNITGSDVDLLQTPSYTFNALTTDYASRFKLVFATGNSSDDDNFAFMSNGNIIVNNEGEATLQVIDVNGRIIRSESINGAASVSMNAAAGVYMLRLVNGENVKVQKMIVK